MKIETFLGEQVGDSSLHWVGFKSYYKTLFKGNVNTKQIRFSVPVFVARGTASVFDITT